MQSSVESQRAERRTDEDFILNAGVSPNRREEFLGSYLQDRRNSSTVEAIFQKEGAYEDTPQRVGESTFGFHMLLRKGPLVEGSSWAPYRTWEFALAMQRRLMGMLEEILGASQPVHQHEPSLSGLLQAVDTLVERARERGVTPSLAVVSGGIGNDILPDFWKHRDTVPDWELKDLQSRVWLWGTYKGLPVLSLREANTQGVHVVDVRRLATLRKHGGLEFDIEEFDVARAEELLSQNEEIVSVQEGEEDTNEERLRELRLRVGLKLYESYSFAVRDAEAAVFSAER